MPVSVVRHIATGTLVRCSVCSTPCAFSPNGLYYNAKSTKRIYRYRCIWCRDRATRRATVERIKLARARQKLVNVLLERITRKLPEEIPGIKQRRIWWRKHLMIFHRKVVS